MLVSTCHSEKEKLAEEGDDEREDVPTVICGPQPNPTSAAASEEDSGKIVFKRPVKRRRSSEGVLDASTKKTKDQSGDKVRRRRRSSSGVKNSSLLSFGDEEDN